jgi:hypothetical protein
LLACFTTTACTDGKRNVQFLVLDFPTASAVEEDLPWGLEKEGIN